jgi:excisionase family DNA binding protein
MNDIVLISISQEELHKIIREAVREELNCKKEKEFLSFRETCDYLGISSSALNKWKSENRVPYKKLGKRIFFSRQELLDTLKESNYSKLQELKNK